MPTNTTIQAWGFKNAEYDLYIIDLVKNMTKDQQKLIPEQIFKKIYRGKDIDVDQLNDAQKDYLVSVVFGKKIIKLVEDPNSQMSMEDYLTAKAAYLRNTRRKINATDVAEKLIVNGYFSLVPTDIMWCHMYWAIINHSPTYKLLLKARVNLKRKSKGQNKFEEAKFAATQIAKMISNYEATKKKFTMDHQINMSEWYLLLWLYDGEKLGSVSYNSYYLYAYHSNRVSLITGLGRLTNDGYIIKRGGKRSPMYSLTAKGKELVDQVIMNVILNY